MSYTHSEADKRVKALVAYHAGARSEDMSGSTEICVDGIDAEWLLEDFCARFSVDIESIQFDRHFGPELPFNPFALLRKSWWQWRRDRIPVTIELLTRAAMTGIWPVNYESKTT